MLPVARINAMQRDERQAESACVGTAQPQGKRVFSAPLFKGKKQGRRTSPPGASSNPGQFLCRSFRYLSIRSKSSWPILAKHKVPGYNRRVCPLTFSFVPRDLFNPSGCCNGHLREEQIITFMSTQVRNVPFSAIRKSPFFHSVEPLREELHTCLDTPACAAAAQAGRECRSKAVAPYRGEEEVVSGGEVFSSIRRFDGLPRFP